MKFTCHTTYNPKALTAMARAVRKTVRAKTSRMAHIYAWIVMGVTLVAFFLSWGEPWRMGIDAAILVGLLLIQWKEDAINGYFAKRKALPGTESAHTTFYPDGYVVKTETAESRWQYDKIMALAETKGYILFVMGEHHALAMDKTALEGGSLQEFRHFLEETTGKQIQNIGG